MPTEHVIQLLQLIVSGIAVVAFALGLWILNSISKRVSEIASDVKRAHERIDIIVDKRMTAWIEKEVDCGAEKAAIADHEGRLKNLENHK